MSLAQRIQQQFQDSAQVKLAALAAMAAPIEAATRCMAACLQAGGKVMACGNGGSAADSQHFAAELVNRFEKERPPLAAIALTTDTSTLTSIANDYRYEDVFAKQVQAARSRRDDSEAKRTALRERRYLAADATEPTRRQRCHCSAPLVRWPVLC